MDTTSVLPITIVLLDGGKEPDPQCKEPPDMRHWQIEEFLRQTGKSDNTQRVYRGQLIRFAAWCDKSWLDVTPSDIGKYPAILILERSCLSPENVSIVMTPERLKRARTVERTGIV